MVKQRDRSEHKRDQRHDERDQSKYHDDRGNLSFTGPDRLFRFRFDRCSARCGLYLYRSRSRSRFFLYGFFLNDRFLDRFFRFGNSFCEVAGDIVGSMTMAVLVFPGVNFYSRILCAECRYVNIVFRFYERRDLETFIFFWQQLLSPPH